MNLIRQKQLKKELAEIFNKNNIDGVMNIPDFMLAELVVDHLILIKNINQQAKSWESGS